MWMMLRWTLLIMLLIVETACVSTINYEQGIASFRAEDYRQAFIRLKPEAAKGQPDAQYAVGYMYYYGQGVEEDRKQAWIWINRAAEAGQRDAIIALKVLGDVGSVN